MKWILLIGLLWAAPPTKVSNSKSVKVNESFSLASLGVEQEAFRIQQMKFQGKFTYMVGKLVDGNLSTEKQIEPAVYNQLKAIVQPLTKIESSEDCKKPISFTFRTNGKEDQRKLCSEKSNVSGPNKRFAAKARTLLGVSKSEDMHERDTSFSDAPAAAEAPKDDAPPED